MFKPKQISASRLGLTGNIVQVVLVFDEHSDF
jgi:hypothetical protein